MMRSARFRTIAARLALGLIAIGLALCGGAARSGAQTEVGAICVATFADLNGNGMREESELPLASITVNLATGGAIIATHVMAEGEDQFCFESLLTGAYTITFADNPAFRTTTANEGTFNLDAGQRLTITDFGAVPMPAADPSADQPADTGATVLETTSAEEPIDPSVRLLISTVAALGVMVFMIGVGAILLGWMGLDPRRARRRAARGRAGDPPPPAHIKPPGA